MAYSVYMLRLANGRIYVGNTSNLERRLGEHHAGRCWSTARWRPVALIWHEAIESKSDALARERQLKGWTRAKKLALVRGDWKQLSRLARGRDRD